MGYVWIGHGCVEVLVFVEVFGLFRCANILYVRAIVFD